MAKSKRNKKDCIQVNLKNIGPTLFEFITFRMKGSFMTPRNRPWSFCGRDFLNKRLYIKSKQNHLKGCDLAPLSLGQTRMRVKFRQSLALLG